LIIASPLLLLSVIMLQFATVFKARDLFNDGNIVAVKKVSVCAFVYCYRNKCNFDFMFDYL